MSLLIILEKKRSTARSLFFFKLFCSDQIHTCINRKVVYERIEEEKIFFYLCTCICYVRTRICQTRKLHIDREREKKCVSELAIFYLFIDEWIGKRNDEMKVMENDRRAFVCDDDDDHYLPWMIIL